MKCVESVAVFRGKSLEFDGLVIGVCRDDGNGLVVHFRSLERKRAGHRGH